MNVQPESMAVPLVQNLPQPYLLFLGAETEPGYAKTAFGLRDWAAEQCVGEYAYGGGLSTGLPPMTPDEARAKGARSMVIGVANPGGVVLESWMPALVEALVAGLDIVSGMHAPLGNTPRLAEAARQNRRRLIDVRRPPSNIPIAKGSKRSGKRLLTVGTDCALGKKYTALALSRAFEARGMDAEFRATGQTGILIAGSGIPMDAVVADFAAGAAEMLSPAAAPDHWDVIEGQGSIYHPAYAGVSLALLHGSQPDVFVVCHEPGRDSVLGFPDFPLPTIEEVIDLTLRLGSRTNPKIRCGGISFNTSRFDEREAKRLVGEAAARLDMPVADPIHGGLEFMALVDKCLA